MKTYSIIVAIAKNNAIGKNNDLLWHISEDLKRFKQITLNHTVIMGQRTYESLPVRPFPNRRNVVITDISDLKIPGCEMAYSLQQAMDLGEDGENFITGGASIYKQLMPFCNKMYLTVVNKDFDGDVFFPEIDFSEWELQEESETFTDPKNGLEYCYKTYIRKSKI